MSIPARTVRVAACQTPEFQQNIEAALTWIEESSAKAALKGARLICFPECFLQGYVLQESVARRHALSLGSAQFEAILGRLAKIDPMVVFGLTEAADGCLFNTAVVVDRGKLVGSYRKTHLLDGERVFTAGTAYPVFQVDHLKFGINICYDTNFPEAARAISAQGGDLIVCPANNMMRRDSSEKWKDLHNGVRSERAREARLWLISSDVTGETAERNSYGPTAVINPDGVVVAQVPLLEAGMVVEEIDRPYR